MNTSPATHKLIFSWPASSHLPASTFDDATAIQTTILSIPHDVIKELIFQKHLLPEERIPLPFVCKKFKLLCLTNETGYAQLAVEKSAKQGHIRLLEWYRDILHYPLNNARICVNAAWGGQLAALQWARANDCPLDEDTTMYAASNGHLEVLQWARTNGCPWSLWTCVFAAGEGHLEVLKWAHANGCPWDDWTCRNAAQGGHLEILQWARANGCPWDKFTCLRAADGGHLEVLQWVRANGCPWHEETWNYAHDRVKPWLLANGCPGAQPIP